MGIIVRDTASKEILFYMKGADTVMSSIGKSVPVVASLIFFKAQTRRRVEYY
jgi:hypothetical protein